MDISQLVKLESQAWKLRTTLDRLIMSESAGYAVKFSTPQMKRKLYRAHATAYERFLRRQDALFNYQPDGFAPSLARPSGVVGQGALS